MPSCVFRKCKNYTLTVKDRKDISFHLIPNEEFLKEKWVSIIRYQRREEDWLPTRYSKICSEHFKSDDVYYTKKNMRKLKKTAIPIIQEHQQSPISWPTSLHLNNISAGAPIFDTPKTDLKRKLQECSEVLTSDKQQNNNLVKKNKRLSNKSINLKKIILDVKNKYDFSDEQFNELNIRAEAVEFKNRLLQRSKFGDPRQKYTPALRKFAVTLHYYSVAAYKYVRKVFNNCLPHPRVIGKWYENDSGEPGFNKQSLDILKKKYINSGKRILCALIADEMSIRQQTIWTGKTSEGFVDYGAGASDVCDKATQAYVFILVCLNENWKLPVAYFLVNGLPAEVRANLLKTCLTQCYNVGVDIAVITFDGCASNLNAANILGCDFSNPICLKSTFRHPECDIEVGIMLDPRHMIKLVRNTLEAKRLIFDGNSEKISWQLIMNLVKLQKNVGLDFANKITARHIHFRNEIMKVKLATRVMSMSVANALKLCNEILTSSLFKNTEATIGFITVFNNLFDIFNSKSSNLYGFKKPVFIKNTESVFQNLEIARQYILALSVFIKYRHTVQRHVTKNVVMKKVVETKHKTGFLGFLICIETLKHLYNTLVLGGRLQYIATNRLSQDHIELFFGAIRRHGGYNNNPNAVQFKRIYQKILQHLEITSPFLGNSIPLENIPILTCTSAIETINATLSRRDLDESYDFNKEIFNSTDPIIDDNIGILCTMLDHEGTEAISHQEQIIGYISGWVTKKLVKELKCETCITYLFANKKMWFHKLINIKNMGGLCIPSEDVFKICCKSEDIMKKLIKEKGQIILEHNNDEEFLKIRILKSFLFFNSNIFQSLSIHSQPPTSNHRLHLIRAVIEKFVNLRLHHPHKISETNRQGVQQRNKLTLFEGT